MSVTEGPGPASKRESTSDAVNRSIHLEVCDSVAVMTLGNPDGSNSIDLAMGVALRDAVRRLSSNPPRVLLIRGSDKGFLMGGDVKRFHELLGHSKRSVRDELAALIDAVHEAISAMKELPCPVISAVRGGVAGFGMSLALASDMVIAAEDAKFVFAYGSIGATPDGGLSWHLPRCVGLQRALFIALTNPTITASQAQALGMVSITVEHSEFESTTQAIVNRLKGGPYAAQANIKALFRDALETGLEAALAAEKKSFLEMSMTEDFAEGVAAFCEKRAARFG
tara:strand:- start:2512 stop:3357 length:846 start_codon:yes stop_codon:yes gene_type:complete